MRATIALVLGLCLVLQASVLTAQETSPRSPRTDRPRPERAQAEPESPDRPQVDEDESEDERARSLRRRRARRLRDGDDTRDFFVSADAGIRVPRPQGWRDAQTPRGSLVVFVAPGQVPAQFEVRVSRDISPRNRDQFVTTFHNNLRRAGMREIERRADMRRGEYVGDEVEYAVLSNGQEFHLIVWIYWRGDDAWIFSAFMPQRRREAFYRTFARMLRGVEFTGR